MFSILAACSYCSLQPELEMTRYCGTESVFLVRLPDTIIFGMHDRNYEMVTPDQSIFGFLNGDSLQLPWAYRSRLFADSIVALAKCSLQPLPLHRVPDSVTVSILWHYDRPDTVKIYTNTFLANGETVMPSSNSCLSPQQIAVRRLLLPYLSGEYLTEPTVVFGKDDTYGWYSLRISSYADGQVQTRIALNYLSSLYQPYLACLVRTPEGLATPESQLE